MAVTQTEELTSQYFAGLVAASRIDQTDDVDSYGALEAVSNAVLAAISPRWVLLPIHDLKKINTQTTIAVVYISGRLMALAKPEPVGEHLFDLRVRVIGRTGDYTIWVESPSEDIAGTCGGTHFDFAVYAYLHRRNGRQRSHPFRPIDRSFDGEEWVRHLIAAQVKDTATARLESVCL